jgi:trehalose 6-phosphate phosphatase
MQMKGSSPAPLGREPAELPLLDMLPGACSEWALFLDLDGTLIDIADRPEAVVVPADLLPNLAALALYFAGAVAIVTGRRLDDVDRLFGPMALPVAAQHGAAIRLDGHILNPPEVTDVPESLAEALLAFVRQHPGLLLEPKGESIAVHFRKAPDLGPLVESQVYALVAEHAPAHDVQPGKMVYEIKPRGVDKGRAVLALLDTPAFRGRRPAFFGDDLTDEAGFVASASVGGQGTIIGTPPRLTMADTRLSSPADMRDFLARLAARAA